MGLNKRTLEFNRENWLESGLDSLGVRNNGVSF
jgi:hypothetical protein